MRPILLTGREPAAEMGPRQSEEARRDLGVVRQCAQNDGELNKPSGRGSCPPGAFGNSCWQSGILPAFSEEPYQSPYTGHTVLPRKRMPSSESSTEPCPASTTTIRSAPPTFADLPNERLDASSSSIDLIQRHLAYDFGPVVSASRCVRTEDTEHLLGGRTNFLSFFIFSISPGSLSAKVSLSD